MPEYSVNPQTQETWTRGQIFRTAIIFLEIVVLLTAVLLNSMNGADVPTAKIIPLPQVGVNTIDTDRVPTTIYVTSGFRVFVIQNTVHRLVGRLAECNNRYLDASFDGVLLSDSFAFSRHDIIHMATFMTDTYDIEANSTQVTLILDDGRSYAVGLHCNGQLGADNFSSQAAHSSTGLEDLLNVAQRHNNYAYDYFDYSDLEHVASSAVSETRASYDYGAGYGCQGDHR
jgi:hypothetical protein